MQNTLASEFKLLLNKNEVLKKALELTPTLNLPNWYIGAGVLSQTVWNYYHGFKIEENIKDIDLVYFDKDTSYKAEDKYIRAGKQLFSSLPVEVEIRNQARVHLWYFNHFGKHIQAYSNTEEGISSWPTTATSVGVRKSNNFLIYAPFGLTDLMNMVVRPNKKLVTREMYENKVKRWSETWPNLKVIPW